MRNVWARETNTWIIIEKKLHGLNHFEKFIAISFNF